jgi:peroxiredoxin
MVAISPERPDHTLATAQKNGVTFEVLSDSGNAVARRFGLVFQFSPDLRNLYQNVFKNDLAAKNGDPTFSLPIPATFVVDRQGTIRLAHVDPDYTQRLEPSNILSTLEALRGRT